MTLLENAPMMISLKKKDGRADAFMREFWDETHAHPMMRKENRLLCFSPDDYVMIVCRPDINDPNAVHISDINTMDRRGKGWGTKALQWLNELADKHNVTLTGLSKSYMSDQSRDVLKQKDLTSWYLRHGFEAGSRLDGGQNIRRHPKPRET